jgi:MFS family permease
LLYNGSWLKGKIALDSKGEKNRLPRNVWVVAVTSFLTDVSSEMIVNLLPLFLNNVLGVRTAVIGLIEGVAESVASILKLFSGWISDKLGMRKWLAVIGYAVSTLSKPIFYFASTWEAVAGARWGDRMGKGIRTAPRDALVADSVDAKQRGYAFGFHRAADTAGAFIGLIITFAAVWFLQGSGNLLKAHTFRVLVLISLVPAALAVIALAVGARDVRPVSKAAKPRFGLLSLGRRFAFFMIVIGVFELGNSSDAFLVLRAQQKGLSIFGIIGMLIAFNLVYTLVSVPAGKLSDRIGRKTVIATGWGFYALIYLGMAIAGTALHVVVLYILYGFYYGLTYGTAKALVVDIVEPELRGIAFGTYNAVLGISDLPASLIAGVLWSGVGSWKGFGPSAPFFFGAAMAMLALGVFLFWKPTIVPGA